MRRHSGGAVNCNILTRTQKQKEGNASVTRGSVQPLTFKRPSAKAFRVALKQTFSKTRLGLVCEIYGSALRCSVFCLTKTVCSSNSEALSMPDAEGRRLFCIYR